jgi:ubiquinone/menaquinone biosynthesis C-methylase UbiE
MKLNRLEFYLMNNPIRSYVQEKYEFPLLLNMLSAKSFDSVLEIGCGSGNGTRLIKKYFNPKQITAIDLDEKMIQLAQVKIQDENISFRVMDAVKLDFPDNSFDAVFDFGIIHHIPNWRICINELRRVLKFNGKLILEELSIESFTGVPGSFYKSLLAHPYDQMYSIEKFLTQLEKANFKINHIKSLIL